MSMQLVKVILITSMERKEITKQVTIAEVKGIPHTCKQ
jgi:hypothetical protein